MQTDFLVVIAVCQVALTAGTLLMAWNVWRTVREFRKFFHHMSAELEPFLLGMRHGGKIIEMMGGAGEKLARASILGCGSLLEEWSNKFMKKESALGFGGPPRLGKKRRS